MFDLVRLLLKCTVREAFDYLASIKGLIPEPVINIIKVNPQIQNETLLRYARSRAIGRDVLNKFGSDAQIISPRAATATLEELSRRPFDGTYLEKPRPDVRTVFFQDGEFRTSARSRLTLSLSSEHFRMPLAMDMTATFTLPTLTSLSYFMTGWRYGKVITSQEA